MPLWTLLEQSIRQWMPRRPQNKTYKKKMQLLKDSTTLHHHLKQVSPPQYRIIQILWTTMSSSLQLPGRDPVSTNQVLFAYPAKAPACNCLATVPGSSLPVIATQASTYPAVPPLCTYSVSHAHIFRPVRATCFCGFRSPKTATSSDCNTQRNFSK